MSVGKHKVYSAEIPLTIQTFARATKSVSSAKYPILAAAIPIYDWLIDKLKEFKAQSGITEKMSNALEMDLDKLQEYCERSADCYMYPVATRGFIQLGALSPFTLVLNTNILKVLVPRLKLDYYKKKKWDKRWIAESKRIVAEIYENTTGHPLQKRAIIPMATMTTNCINTCTHIIKPTSGTSWRHTSAHQ